jgi:serine/threonine protein kinase
MLSDVSQSLQSLESPLSTDAKVKEVVLWEVVRCTKRIVEGARAFQTNDDDKPTKCHHSADGPPLKVLLMGKSLSLEPRVKGYVSKLMEAFAYLTIQLPGLDWNDRVAILAPSTQFIELVKPELEASLLLSGRKIQFATADEASRTVSTSRISSPTEKDCLVLDTVDNFNGLERLIVIAVDLDSPMDQGAAAETRSQLYRALTRSQMMVVVVNVVLHGGWLEFLTRVEFDEEGEFDAEKEAKKNTKGEARGLLEKEEERARRRTWREHELAFNYDSDTLSEGDCDTHSEGEEQKEDEQAQQQSEIEGTKIEAPEVDGQGRDAGGSSNVSLQSAVWDTSAMKDAGIEARSVDDMRRDGFMPLQGVDGYSPTPARKGAGEQVVIWQHGDEVTKCTITRILSKSSEGWVYEVVGLSGSGLDDLLGGKSRALKCTSFSHGINEIRTMLHLNSQYSHANVLQINSVYSPVESPQLLSVMELIRGPKEGIVDLHQAIKDGILYEGHSDVVDARLLSYTTQLAFALEHVHSRGLVHQDIKPGNILLDARQDGPWRIVLTSFGLATSGEVEADTGRVHGAKLQGCTPMFCSKEVYSKYRQAIQSGKQQSCSCAADVWSFASTVVSMYSYGEDVRPMRTLGSSEIESILARLTSAESPRSKMPEGVKQVLLRILNNPDSQISSKQLADRLCAISGSPARPQPKTGINAERQSDIDENLDSQFQQRSFESMILAEGPSYSSNTDFWPGQEEFLSEVIASVQDAALQFVRSEQPLHTKQSSEKCASFYFERVVWGTTAEMQQLRIHVVPKLERFQSQGSALLQYKKYPKVPKERAVFVADKKARTVKIGCSEVLEKDWVVSHIESPRIEFMVKVPWTGEKVQGRWVAVRGEGFVNQGGWVDMNPGPQRMFIPPDHICIVQTLFKAQTESQDVQSFNYIYLANDILATARASLEGAGAAGAVAVGEGDNKALKPIASKLMGESVSPAWRALREGKITKTHVQIAVAQLRGESTAGIGGDDNGDRNDIPGVLPAARGLGAAGGVPYCNVVLEGSFEEAEGLCEQVDQRDEGRGAAISLLAELAGLWLAHTELA